MGGPRGGPVRGGAASLPHAGSSGVGVQSLGLVPYATPSCVSLNKRLNFSELPAIQETWVQSFVTLDKLFKGLESQFSYLLNLIDISISYLYSVLNE